MFGVVELSRPIVIEDVPKYIRVSVEEVFFALLVVEELAFVGSEQRVWILFERVPPGLEPSPGDVDEELLVIGLSAVLWNRGWRKRVGGDGHPADGRRPGKWQPSGDRGHAMRRNVRTITTHLKFRIRNRTHSHDPGAAGGGGRGGAEDSLLLPLA